MNLSIDDRLAIQDLYSRFAFAMDSGDAEAWANFFTDDAVFIARETWTGRAAIREMTESTVAGIPDRPVQRAQHHFYNLVVEGDGVTANASCYLTFTGQHMESGEIRTVLLGVYVDELRKEADGWRFARKHLRQDVPRLNEVGLDR